jgi:hypothetical protein
MKLAQHRRKKFSGPAGRKSLAGGGASRAEGEGRATPGQRRSGRQSECRDTKRMRYLTRVGVTARALHADHAIGREEYLARKVTALPLALSEAFTGGCTAPGCAVLVPPPANFSPAHSGLDNTMRWPFRHRMDSLSLQRDCIRRPSALDSPESGGNLHYWLVRLPAGKRDLFDILRFSVCFGFRVFDSEQVPSQRKQCPTSNQS